MTKLYVDSADLTAVADAIRAKTEKSAAITFPGGFVSEIAGISGAVPITNAHLFFGSGFRLDSYPAILASFQGTTDYSQCFIQLLSSTFTECSTTGADFSQMRTCESMFQDCSYLQQIDLSMMNKITGQGSFLRAFSGCSALKRLCIGHFGTGVEDSQYCFMNTRNLEELVILGTEGIFTITSYNAFNGSSIELTASNAKIYVPDALVADYKAATNWSTYAAKIFGLSDYPGTPWWDAANQ